MATRSSSLIWEGEGGGGREREREGGGKREREERGKDIFERTMNYSLGVFPKKAFSRR